jgi:sugar phosphate isomerase/epimerase
MGALRSRHDIPLGDSINEVRRQIENAGALALPYLLTFGVDKPGEYEHYYKVMSDAAAYAEEHRIKLVMKPHGGSSGASDEIMAAMRAVHHPNFKIWYDAADHGRVLQGGPNCGRDGGERAGKSSVPRSCPGAGLS